MKKEIVTFEIAKLAKDKGFNNVPCCYYYVIGFSTIKENKELKFFERKDEFGDVIGKHEVKSIGPGQPHLALAPTYHQLIEWVFEKKFMTPKLQHIYSEFEWLEMWYDVLKDCPLKFEYKGRVRETWQGR